MKLGISGQALGQACAFEEIVRMGQKYGIQDFEIWPCNAGVLNDYAQADLAGLKETLKNYQARASCVTLGAAFDPQINEDPKIYSSWLMHAIDAAKFLGAPVVNHYCYHISRESTPDFKRMEAFWQQPTEYAEGQGVVLVLENEAHDSTATPRQMLQILQHFNSPYFKTNFDAVNYFHSSCEGFPAAYEILRPYIGYVHLKNACLYRPDSGQPQANRGDAMSGHYAPAPIQYCTLPDGSVNMAGLLTRIAQDGEYRGVCTLEPHTRPEFVESFYARESAWLRSLGFFQK